MEPVHLECAFGGGELRTDRNSKTSAISDFETIHSTQNIFFDIGAPGNRDFGGPRMPWVLRKFDNLGDFEPAGELSEQISEILGGISRNFKNLEGFSKKNRGFSRFWKDFPRIQEPQPWISNDFNGFLSIFIDFLRTAQSAARASAVERMPSQ